MPAVRLDMRLVVDGSPTVEADTVPGCLDRLTLAVMHRRSHTGGRWYAARLFIRMLLVVQR